MGFDKNTLTCAPCTSGHFDSTYKRCVFSDIIGMVMPSSQCVWMVDASTRCFLLKALFIYLIGRENSLHSTYLPISFFQDWQSCSWGWRYNLLGSTGLRYYVPETRLVEIHYKVLLCIFAGSEAQGCAEVILYHHRFFPHHSFSPGVNF